MSNRRHLDPLLDERYSRNFSIQVVCAHGVDGDTTVIGHLMDMRRLTHRTADLMAPDTGRDGGPLRNEPLTAWTGDDGHRRWKIRCPRCRDNWPPREENLLRVIDVLRVARGAGQDEEHLVLEIGLARKIAERLHSG